MSQTRSRLLCSGFDCKHGICLILSSDYQEFWRFGFWLVGFISLWTGIQLIKYHKTQPTEETISNMTSKIDFRILTDKKVLFFLSLISLTIFAEQIFNSWLPIFYKNSLNSSAFFALQSSAFLAFFSFLGRIISSKQLKRFSRMKIFYTSLNFRNNLNYFRIFFLVKKMV